MASECQICKMKNYHGICPHGNGTSAGVPFTSDIKSDAEQLKIARSRILQLESDFKTKSFFLPPEPDPALADDEWYATFSDFRAPILGTLSKYQPTALTGHMSHFKVKRVW